MVAGTSPTAGSTFRPVAFSSASSSANAKATPLAESQQREATPSEKKLSPPSLWQQLSWRVQSALRAINLTILKWGSPVAYEKRRLTVIHELGHALTCGNTFSPLEGIGLQGTYKHFQIAYQASQQSENISYETTHKSQALTLYKDLPDSTPSSTQIQEKLGSVAVLMAPDTLTLKPELIRSRLSASSIKGLNNSAWFSFGHDITLAAGLLLDSPDLIKSESDKAQIKETFDRLKQDEPMPQDDYLALVKQFLRLDSVRPHFEAAGKPFEGITGEQWRGISETVLQRGVVQGPKELKTLCDTYFGAGKVAVAMPQQLETAA